MSRNLDGNQKDIDNGTHIKIPMDIDLKSTISWICELLQVCELIRDNCLDEVRNPAKKPRRTKVDKQLSSSSSKLKT